MDGQEFNSKPSSDDIRAARICNLGHKEIVQVDL